MPSYLFNDQSPAVTPYQAPTELMLKAGMYRDEKFKEGLQNIRGRYDNLLNLQLTNPGNQQFVRSQVKAAVDQLDKYNGADLSLPENQGALNNIFDPVTEDSGVMNDIAFTQNIAKQKATIERLTQEKPDLVNPANVFPILQAEQKYRSGSRTATPDYVAYEPYHDYEKGDNEFLGKLKEDIYSDPSVMFVTDPVTGKPTALRGDREVKEISRQRIGAAMNQSFDPKKLRQMELNYNYGVATGIYGQTGAITGIEQDMNALRPSLADARSKINSLNLPPTEVQKLRSLIDRGDSEMTRLGKLKEAIAVDPSAATQYYTFNKYLSDYVDQKADVYSTKQQGEFKMNEGDKMNYKYTLDTYLESLKNELDIKKQAAKGKASSSSNPETGLQEDGSYAYEPPLKKYLDKIDETGHSHIDWQSPEIIPLIGNSFREKDGSITYSNTGGGDKVPEKRIFLREGKETLDEKGASALRINDVLNVAATKLERDNPTNFVKTIPIPDQSSAAGLYMNSPNNPNALHPGSQATTQKVHLNPEETASEIARLYSNYQKDPSSVKAKYKPIFEEIKQGLAAAGVTDLDEATLGAYKQFVKSDKGQSMLDVGMLLNADGKGKYEFIPDGSNNLVKLSEGKMGIAGSFKVTEGDLERLQLSGGGKTKRLLEQGVLTAVPPDIVYMNDKNDKAVKTTQKTYYMSVVLPVNGDLETINKQMFEEGDMKNIELKERYNAMRLQESAFREDKNARDLGSAQLQKVGENVFRPVPGSQIDTQVNNVLKQINENKTITPEQYKAINDMYRNLINTPQSKVRLINNLNIFLKDTNTLLQGANSQSGVSTTIPTPTGDAAADIRAELAYRESRGNYNATNSSSSAAGKYQFLWKTWKDKITNVTGVDSKEGFLKNPAAQEQFYEWYQNNEMLPAIGRLQKYNTQNLSAVQLGKLFHFRGEQGAIDYLQGKVADKPEDYNSSISAYLAPLNSKKS